MSIGIVRDFCLPFADGKLSNRCLVIRWYFSCLTLALSRYVAYSVFSKTRGIGRVTAYRVGQVHPVHTITLTMCTLTSKTVTHWQW